MDLCRALCSWALAVDICWYSHSRLEHTQSFWGTWRSSWVNIAILLSLEHVGTHLYCGFIFIFRLIHGVKSSESSITSSNTFHPFRGVPTAGINIQQLIGHHVGPMTGDARAPLLRCTRFGIRATAPRTSSPHFRRGPSVEFDQKGQVEETWWVSIPLR